MSEFSIVLRGISKKFDHEVLRNINLEIAGGSYISIVGRSGSGKSTLLNIIGLIERFDSGEYFFEGEKILNFVDYSELRSQRIGFIFQNYNLIPNMTVRENILLPFLYSSNEEYLNNEIIDKLQINDLMDKKAYALSGGEKQRVAIARTMVLKPSIVIADEPTGNLDEENKKIVLDMFSYINCQGCAVLVISHDYHVAACACKIYELKGG